MFPTPNVSGNRIKLSTAGYLKAIGTVVLVFLMIFLYMRELDHFRKTIDFQYLLIISLLLGLIAGIGIGKRFAIKEDELFEQMRIYVVCVVLATIAMPLLVSLTNRFLDFRSPKKEVIEILKIEASTAKPFGYSKGEKISISQYRLTVLLNGKVSKFSSSKNVFENNKAGDIIEVPVYQGSLGVQYLGL